MAPANDVLGVTATASSAHVHAHHDPSGVMVVVHVMVAAGDHMARNLGRAGGGVNGGAPMGEPWPPPESGPLHFHWPAL